MAKKVYLPLNSCLGFENIFKVAFYGPIQKGIATKESGDAAIVDARKEVIKKEVLEKMGLRIFEIGNSGSGSTNNGKHHNAYSKHLFIYHS